MKYSDLFEEQMKETFNQVNALNVPRTNFNVSNQNLTSQLVNNSYPTSCCNRSYDKAFVVLPSHSSVLYHS